MDDLDKYVLEQAKIEVEHTRSWPTKVLAFYVAINAAVVTGLFSLASRVPSAITLSSTEKVRLTVVLVVLAVWSCYLLVKNHYSYLAHRNIQIKYQKANREDLEKRGYPLPRDWFIENELSLRTRLQGWGFYAFLVACVAALGILGVWTN